MMKLWGKKIREKLDRLSYVGTISFEEAEAKEMRVVMAQEGMLRIYLLVDKTDGVIADAKYQLFGPPLLIVVAEIVCQLLMRKNYDQASRISADLIEQQVKEKKESAPSFPKEGFSFINQALMVIDQLVQQCQDLPFHATDYEKTPISYDSFPEGGIVDWQEKTMNEKLELLHQVIDIEIRPYVELDAGGVKVQELKENGEVYIAYEGSCTSCHSATGSTLTAIQQILRNKLHQSLTVIPVL